MTSQCWNGAGGSDITYMMSLCGELWVLTYATEAALFFTSGMSTHIHDSSTIQVIIITCDQQLNNCRAGHIIRAYTLAGCMDSACGI